MKQYLVNIIRNISAIGLAAVVFITTTGFQYNAHYCAGNLKSFSFYGEAKACKHEAKKAVKKPCSMHGEMKFSDISENECCDYEDVTLDPSSYEAVALAKVKTDFHFEYVFQADVIAIPEGISDAQLDFITTYRPPPIDRDIYVMVQSFLL